MKNCKNTAYVIINANVFLENIYCVGKKNKVLKIIKFYENSIKSQITNKQFIPYGDIYIFFCRNKIKQVWFKFQFFFKFNQNI